MTIRARARKDARSLARVVLVLAPLLLPVHAGGEASRDAVGHPTLLDPSARLLTGDEASEYWDLVARLDGGYHVFARFAITNVGPGKHTAVVIGHVVKPDGTTQLFKNGRRRHEWNISADRLRLDVGSSHLDLHGPEYQLSIQKRRTKIDLRFTPTRHTPSPRELAVPGYEVELLDAGAAGQGSIWLEGMSDPVSVRGRVGLVHTWATRNEARFVQRRFEFFSLQDDGSLYLIHLTTPQGDERRWLTVDNGAHNLHSSADFEVELGGAIRELERSRYWVPGFVQLAGAGTLGRVFLGPIFLEHDPLRIVPQPFRFLLSRKMQPHRVWSQPRFDVVLGRGDETTTVVSSDPLRIQGSGVAVTSFLNPVSQPVASRAPHNSPME